MKKNLFKRVPALLLSAIMVFGSVSVMAQQVYQPDTNEGYQTYETYEDYDGYKQDNVIENVVGLDSTIDFASLASSTIYIEVNSEQDWQKVADVMAAHQSTNFAATAFSSVPSVVVMILYSMENIFMHFIPDNLHVGFKTNPVAGYIANLYIGSYQRHFTVNGKLTLENINITRRNPQSDELTGGIEVNGGILAMQEGSSITGNRAQYGGGVLFRGGELFMHPSSSITNNQAVYGGGIAVFGGELDIQHAVIEGNRATNGGGVFVGPDSSLMMGHGSEIVRNTGNRGGGINVSGYNAAFDMTGGTIGSNLQIRNGQQRGAGVFLGAGAVFNMTGGIIQDHHALNTGSNNASHGTGGVFITGEGTVFNMSGDAHITNATSTWNGQGGAVHVREGAMFNMSGNSLISASLASISGGSVYLTGRNSVFNMSGNATLDGDRSHLGGTQVTGSAVAVRHDAVFNMSDDATIRNHIATNYQGGHGGGGVRISHSGVFNMNGGLITNNQTGLNNSGGGVRVEDGVFNMLGGIISNNTANTNRDGIHLGRGGGVHVSPNGIFNMAVDASVINNHATGNSGGISVDRGIFNGSGIMNGNTNGITGISASSLSAFSFDIIGDNYEAVDYANHE